MTPSRLRASAAWRAALAAYRVASAMGKNDVAIGRTFAFFGDAFKGGGKHDGAK